MPMMTIAEYDQIIRRKASWVKWDEPVVINNSNTSGLACRLCIARMGLNADYLDAEHVFNKLPEFEQHMKDVHGVAK